MSSYNYKVTSPLLAIVTLLITPLAATHEPPSSGQVSNHIP